MSIQSLDAFLTKRNGPAIVRRLRWLEDRLHWHGQFRRGDLTDRFAISAQQASADIADYQEVAPGNLRYDARQKLYVRGDGYAPVFPKNAVEWLRQGRREGAANPIPLEELGHPARQVDAQVMQAVVASYETRTPIRISYQSLSSPAPRTRVICPHHVVDASTRLHARAWDDESREFRDFVLSRIARPAPEPTVPWVDERADSAWNRWITVCLEPHPQLTKDQRRAVSSEYGMTRSGADMKVRQALLLYFLDQLGLVDAVRNGTGVPEVTRWVACANPGELSAMLPTTPAKDAAAVRESVP